jgi:hypothetical protein
MLLLHYLDNTQPMNMIYYECIASSTVNTQYVVLEQQGFDETLGTGGTLSPSYLTTVSRSIT